MDKKEDRTVDYTVPFGIFGGQGAKGFSLTKTDFTPATQATIDQLKVAQQTSFSPIQVTNQSLDKFTVNGVNFDFQFAAIDTTNDGKVNYDSIVVYDAVAGIKADSSNITTLKVGNPSQAYELNGTTNRIGTGFISTNIASDLSTVRLARYSANNIPRPANNPAVLANIDDINNNVGFWKPQPDFRIPEKLSPGFDRFPDAELEAMYADQVKSFVDYQAKVATRSIEQNPNADLVMTYIEQPDGSQHQFLLTDPRQASDYTNPNSIGAGQDPAKVDRYKSYIETAYKAADTAVQKIIDTVGTDANGKPNSDIIVVSDHGFAPFHTAVNLNNLLKSAGFDPNQVRAITSGPSTNIYINVKGREPDGTVDAKDYPALQQKVIDTLKGLVDTNPNYVTGSASNAIFDKVYNRTVPANPTADDILNGRGDSIGQDTGDVFALLKQGYNFDGTQATPVIRKGDTASTTPVLSVPNFYGAHGYDPTSPEMQAIFLAAGPDVAKKELGQVNNIDVAPTIDKILGVQPASTVDGKALNIIAPKPTLAKVNFLDPAAAFPNGVAAGDTTQNSTVLWTRPANLGDVTFEYSTAADFSTIVGTKKVTATTPLQPVKVDVTGLNSNTDYYYRAIDALGDSYTGKFSTAAPLDTPTGLRFGVSGDWRGELAPYSAVANVPDRNLKFFVEHGDTIYADVASAAVLNPDGTEKEQSSTLADYRAKQSEVYSTRFGKNTLADLRASTSVLATIDDHEVKNDFAGGQDLATSSAADRTLYGANSGLINDSPLFENGIRAFNEYNPIQDRVYHTPNDARTNGETKFYRYNTYGSDAATFVLDARSFRDTELAPVTNTNDPKQVADFLTKSFDPSRTMLGKQQVRDLKQDLLDAQNKGLTWKFVMVPEPIENIGILAASDRFEGYAAERTEILKFINDNKISNVVFVSADFHGTLVNNLTYQTAPGSPQIATGAFEVITGAIAYDKPFGPTVADLAAQAGLITAEQKTQYDALPATGKDAFIKNIVNGGLNPLGYDRLGLNDNLPQANGLIDAKLLQGDYLATNTYGWSEFNIDPKTQKLTVTTYGVDAYSREQIEQDPTTFANQTPKIVSQFEVNPQAAAKAASDKLVLPQINLGKQATTKAPAADNNSRDISNLQPNDPGYATAALNQAVINANRPETSGKIATSDLVATTDLPQATFTQNLSQIPDLLTYNSFSPDRSDLFNSIDSNPAGDPNMLGFAPVDGSTAIR